MSVWIGSVCVWCATEPSGLNYMRCLDVGSLWALLHLSRLVYILVVLRHSSPSRSVLMSADVDATDDS